MVKKISDSLTFVTLWASLIIVPHFQSTFTVYSFLSSLVLMAMFALALRRLILQAWDLSSMHFSLIISVYGVLLLISQLLLLRGSSLIYDLWSHLGAGSMKLRGEFVPFGDLAHLSYAAECEKNVVIGEVVCDPWERSFNQNPLVVSVLRCVGLTNLNLLGNLSIVTFLLVSVLFVNRFNSRNIGVLMFLVSPPMILAFERGNEVITLIFVLSGILLIKEGGVMKRSIGAINLAIATLFKIWPVFFCIYFLFFKGGRLGWTEKTILASPVIFWVFNFASVQSILQNTQSGNPFGASFGLKLFWATPNTITTSSTLIFLTLVLFAFLAKKNGNQFKVFVMELHSRRISQTLVPLMLVYVAIWLLSDSFMYRLVILFPILLVLNQKEFRDLGWARENSFYILVTVFSAKLVVASAISTVLSLLFLQAIVILFLNSGPVQNLVSTLKQEKRISIN